MAKKKSKSKVPQKLAGVKVPKALRKSGRLSSLLGSPVGREVIAEALVAAAGAAAAALVRHRPSGAQMKHAGEAVADAGANAGSLAKDLVQGAAGAVAGVVSDAARTVLPASGQRARAEDTPRNFRAPDRKTKTAKLSRERH